MKFLYKLVNWARNEDYHIITVDGKHAIQCRKTNHLVDLSYRDNTFYSWDSHEYGDRSWFKNSCYSSDFNQVEKKLIDIQKGNVTL